MMRTHQRSKYSMQLAELVAIIPLVQEEHPHIPGDQNCWPGLIKRSRLARSRSEEVEVEDEEDLQS